MTFGSPSGPIGKWQPVRAHDAGLPAAAQPDPEQPLDAGAPEPEAPRDAAVDAGPAEPPKRTEPAPAPVTSMAFEVTTAPAGFKYQPKNIGAIWVADASGKLVKSLEVWAATRVRYLTAYNKARAGAGIDVSTRATLPNHRKHQVSWDLKDRSGAPVPRGKYQLLLELTDGDATGKSTAIDFELGAAPSSSTPADAACFSGMQLQLK